MVRLKAFANSFANFLINDFNSTNGAIKSSIHIHHNCSMIISIPQMVRLKVCIKCDQGTGKSSISIPQMVRLKGFRINELRLIDFYFNSTNGAIKSNSFNLT